jgi:competence protein ComFC
VTNLIDIAKPWLNASLALIYPEVCQLCLAERATAREGYVGPHCWSQVRFIRPPFCDRCGLPFEGDLTTKFECSNCREMDLHFTSARSAVVAKTAVLEVIHRFKYARERWFEPFLADLLVREAAPALRDAGWDCLIPVPLHPLKEREREFNQSAVLAGYLARATGLPLETNMLRRVLPTLTQTRLSRAQRAKNIAGAFEFNRGRSVAGQRIVLIDDVFTTGATTNACAQILRRAGAREVTVWTVARGL